MSQYIIQKDILQSIADAIRYKNGTTTKYAPEDMADAIGAKNLVLKYGQVSGSTINTGLSSIETIFILPRITKPNTSTVDIGILGLIANKNSVLFTLQNGSAVIGSIDSRAITISGGTVTLNSTDISLLNSNTYGPTKYEGINMASTKLGYLQWYAYGVE